MKDFSSLAEASKIIDEISKRAEVLYKEDISHEGKNIVEKISSYLEEFFKPLYNCDAIKEHCLANAYTVLIINTKDYERYNKTGIMNYMYKLSLNIPLGIGGGRVFLELVFRENEPAQILGCVNDMTVALLVKSWSRLKENMQNHCENAIHAFNRDAQYKIKTLAEMQNLVKGFEI